MNFSPEIQASAEIVQLITNILNTPHDAKIQTHEHQMSGLSSHHMPVNPSDVVVQKAIIKYLNHRFPEAKFIAEEKQESNLILKTPHQISSYDLIFGVDGIDGSSAQGRDLPIFSHSVGVMKFGKLVGGAIFNPLLNGGTLTIGEIGQGVRVYEQFVHGQKEFQSIKIGAISKTQPPKVNIYLGPDWFLYPQFAVPLSKLHTKREDFQVINTSPSCAWGLAMVAAGRIDVLIQPPQSPWDFFAGAPLVEAAGGQVLWYQQQNGKLHWLTEPDTVTFDPRVRATGIIAGQTDMVKWAWNFLKNNWEI